MNLSLCLKRRFRLCRSLTGNLVPLGLRHLKTSSSVSLTNFEYLFQKMLQLSELWITAYKVSVFGVILVRVFPHLDWIRRDTEYLSVFSPDAIKCRPEQLRIPALFTQWMNSPAVPLQSQNLILDNVILQKTLSWFILLLMQSHIELFQDFGNTS